MLICGSPIGWVMPSRIPKSAGLSWAFGVLVLERRFRPKTRLIDAIPAEGVRLVQREELSSGRWMYPKPGTVLPRMVGSTILVRLKL